MRFYLAVACINAAGAAFTEDLRRAKAKVPRQEYRGDLAGSESTATVLNRHLSQQFSNLKPCEEWTVTELQEFQAELWSRRSLELLEIYDASSDRRASSKNSLDALQEQWASMNKLASASDSVTQQAHRDGHCHEAVMWLVHYLDAGERSLLTKSHLPIPSLPLRKATCDSGGSPTLCSAVANQHSCMYCHSVDEGSGKKLPVPDHKPGHTDTFPVFPKRFIATTSGFSYYNQNGSNQSGAITNQTYTMKYYYDWPNNRMRQDTVYNSSKPSRSGTTWFNGTTKTWYIIEHYKVLWFNIPLCIKMPPPIITIQRPDWVMSASREMPGNGTYVGREALGGSLVDHWRGTFYRENPVGMKSNASFDIWFEPNTSYIKKLVGKCDPPDQQEGSPTLAEANYDTFEEVQPGDSMDQYFDDDKALTRGTRFCIPITPHLSSQVMWRAPGIPAMIPPLHTIKDVQRALPQILREYGAEQVSFV